MISVLMVAAELDPVAKTGGLADMVTTLAQSLGRRGTAVRVVLPGYPRVMEAIIPSARRLDISPSMGEPAGLVQGRVSDIDIDIVAVDMPQLFDRPGDPYRDPQRVAWSDNWRRFGMLSRAAALVATGRTALSPPDIVHLHDWHSALTAAYLPDDGIPVLQTVHNFSFQGRFDRSVVQALGLEHGRGVARLRPYFGGFSFLHAGLINADAVNSVSQTYADSLRRKDRYNRFYLPEGFDKDVLAIQNWVDDARWSPSRDKALPFGFDLATLDERQRNRPGFERAVGLRRCDSPLFCTLSRITRAKGFAFLLREADSMLEAGNRLVFVGDGEPKLTDRIARIVRRWPGQAALISPYSEATARWALAASDGLLMPSLVEPCGLSQQYAQRYGCVPIVSSVGGLIDTVDPDVTGFRFEPSSAASFRAAMERAIETFRDPAAWRALQMRCIRSASSAAATSPLQYLALYRDLLSRRVRRDRP